MPIAGDETSDMPLGPRSDDAIKIKDPGRHATGSTLLNDFPTDFSATNNLDFARLGNMHLWANPSPKSIVQMVALYVVL
ncbi:hypothetical protein JMJ35_001304 [Cladonia borealis]|uniref:Uncharacterized protein n=1 Tax=Cladonia borealis TaxID=184061 RepID=A0AA39UEM2_9LECA|nr:hypothetical protein JMJ35_001304 [Cladonia borealis]